MSQFPSFGDSFNVSSDLEAMQAIVLAAAVNGNAAVRAHLPTLVGIMDEPYRTVAAAINRRLEGDGFLDHSVFDALLSSLQLIRRDAFGQVRALTPAEANNLIFATNVQPGQAEAYVDLLRQKHAEAQKKARQATAADLVNLHGDNPERLLREFERWAAEARSDAGDAKKYPRELLEIVPYYQELLDRQRGSEFLGLDSGFKHWNQICNGLDTGLTVLAAPPGRGKTTLLHQIACQAAELNEVPVIFVSMEQGKDELRAKALARLSKLPYRHLLRGQLRSDDPQNREKLVQAFLRYATIGRYLTIIEGDEDTTVDLIESVAASSMVELKAGRCLIVLDYLQVLPLRKEDVGRVTNTKDRVDLHVSALRRLARKFRSPVIAISSENRAGYNSRALDVFKESGGIEYSADIAMVLCRSKQPDTTGDYKMLDLNVVKNRNGEMGLIKFKFYAGRAEFIETAKEVLTEEEGQ